MLFRNSYDPRPRPLVSEAPFCWFLKDCLGGKFQPQTVVLNYQLKMGFPVQTANLSPEFRKQEKHFSQHPTKKMEILVAFHDRKLITLEVLFKKSSISSDFEFR